MDNNQRLFGYGSIVWKTEFPQQEEVYGYVKQFYRRFWQGSPDHRGVPGCVGRVVTLIHAEDMSQFKDTDEHFEDVGEEPIAWGKAYRIPTDQIPQVLAQLDHREKAGYERAEVEVHCTDNQVRKALVFIATPDNEDFLGPAPTQEMAHQIATRVGPSGPNWEYLINLAKCMRDLNVQDPHLFALEEKVLEIRGQ